MSHKCDKVLAAALLQYAEENGGTFPIAKGNEAALSHLIPDYLDVETVSGKTVDTDEAEAFYEKYGYLSKELSSWHYVDGLADNAPRGLALLWDPSGLGHNGEKGNPAHYAVIYCDGRNEVIQEKEWPQFLEKQKAMLEEWRGRN